MNGMNQVPSMNGMNRVNSPGAMQQPQRQQQQQMGNQMNMGMMTNMNNMGNMGNMNRVNGLANGMANGMTNGIGMNGLSNGVNPVNNLGMSMGTGMLQQQSKMIDANAMGLGMIQQQLQQLNMNNSTPNRAQQQQGNGVNVLGTQFTFPPTATPPAMSGNMVMAPNLFGSNSNTPNPALQQQLMQTGSTPVSNNSPKSGKSTHSGGSGQSAGSRVASEKKGNWSNTQRALGDVLFTMVKKHMPEDASKITGMLLKMGEAHAKQCIDDETYLVTQMQRAKIMLNSQQGNGNLGINSPLTPNSLATQNVMNVSNVTNNVSNVQNVMNINNMYGINSPNGSVQSVQSLGTPNVVTPNNFQTPTKYQTVNTNPVNPLSPNPIAINGLNGTSLPNGVTQIPNLFGNQMPLSNPNSTGNPMSNTLYGGVPNLLSPQVMNMNANTIAGQSMSANNVSNVNNVNVSNMTKNNMSNMANMVNGLNGLNAMNSMNNVAGSSTTPQTPDNQRRAANMANNTA